MLSLEVRGAVRPLQGSLGVKGLIEKLQQILHRLVSMLTSSWRRGGSDQYFRAGGGGTIF